MARAFKKRVRPRPLHVGDLVLKVIRGLIRDPRGKFRPNWSGPYFIRELTQRVHGSWGSLYMLHFIYEGMSFDHWVFEPSFPSFLSPYHLGLRHGIRCRLRQPLLGQVIEIWLIFRYCHASSYGSRL
ncbi:hypothetical protein AAG906_025786 [Vitis piasezkii]